MLLLSNLCRRSLRLFTTSPVPTSLPAARANKSPVEFRHGYYSHLSWTGERSLSARTVEASRATPTTPSPSLKYATILSRQALQTTAKEIIDQIEPVQSSDYPLDIVITVSKGFAHWLSGGDFLSDVVNRICPNDSSTAPGKANVLVGVIDRVTGPQKDNGNEGIAYFADVQGTLIELDDPNHTVPENRQSRLRDLAPERSGSILFHFVSYRRYETVPTSLELGLSNTIFSNGTPFFLAGSKWTRSYEKGTLNMQGTKQFRNASVFLPIGHLFQLDTEHDGKATRLIHPECLEAVVTIPLESLTPRRVISASMGNVIRGIEGAESGASKELEDAVSQYFVDKDMTPEAAAVWALVHPTSPTRTLTKATPLTEPECEIPAKALWHGATLHKVLSGGGGWGNKAGLLSLDPENGLGAEDVAERIRGEEALRDNEEEFRPAVALVRDIVKPGDEIQFFIAPYHSTPTSDHSGEEGTTSIDFGIIPSTMDEIPEEVGQNSDMDSKIVRLQNHFGALSELGMSIVRNPLSPQGIEVFRAKINVPFTRFQIRRAG